MASGVPGVYSWLGTSDKILPLKDVPWNAIFVVLETLRLGQIFQNICAWPKVKVTKVKIDRVHCE